MEEQENIFDLLSKLDWEDLTTIDTYDLPDAYKEAWAELVDDLKNYSIEYGSKENY